MSGPYAPAVRSLRAAELSADIFPSLVPGLITAAARGLYLPPVLLLTEPPVPLPACYASADYRAMLAAVRSNRVNDLARLTLADWLDDQGEADRATFIRVECELAGLLSGVEGRGGMLTGAEAVGERGLQVRRRELLDANRHWFTLPDGVAGAYVGYGEHLPLCWWPAGWPGRPGPATWRLEADTRRGFVAEVRGPAAAWEALGDALAASQPVERVSLTTVPAEVERRGRVPARVTALPAVQAAGGMHAAWTHWIGLAAIRWPGVWFDWPAELLRPDGPAPRRFYRDGTPRTPADEVIVSVAGRFGVRAGEIAGMTPPVDLMSGPHMVRCPCREVTTFEAVRTPPVRLDETTFAARGAPGARWRTWAGRCPECRQVYATVPQAVPVVERVDVGPGVTVGPGVVFG